MRPSARRLTMPMVLFAALALSTLPGSTASAKRVSTAAGTTLLRTATRLPAQSVTKSVNGAVGATLVVGPWTLSLAPGSFVGTTEITATEVVAADGKATVELRIGEQRLNDFKAPVWLIYSDTTPGEMSGMGVYLWNEANQVWGLVPGSEVDHANRKVRVMLAHFSSYSIRGGKAGW